MHPAISQGLALGLVYVFLSIVATYGTEAALRPRGLALTVQGIWALQAGLLIVLTTAVWRLT